MKVGAQKRVSVILPTYNRAECLGEAINSVLAQTYEDFELLIVDDGSTDNTREIVEKYSDSRIQYYKLDINGGQSKARNYGMRLAKGEFIAFEDSDDLWMPQKLEKQMSAFATEKENVGLVYHKYQFDTGEIVPEEEIPLEKKNGNIYEQLLWNNLVGMPTLMIRRECLEEIGYLDENMKCLEDYDFALRLAQKYQAIFIDEVLLKASYSGTGVSSKLYDFMVAKCFLIQKHKVAYLESGAFNPTIEDILHDAEILGIQNEIVGLLEKILQL